MTISDLVAIGAFITALAALGGLINSRNKPNVDRSQGNLNNATAIKTLTETVAQLSDQVEEYRKDNEALRLSYAHDTEALGIEVRTHTKSITDLSEKLQESRDEVIKLKSANDVLLTGVKSNAVEIESLRSELRNSDAALALAAKSLRDSDPDLLKNIMRLRRGEMAAP